MQPLLLRALLLAALLGGWAAAGPEQPQQPGPGRCHPECTKYGNCGENGECRCPYGRIGEGCEIDFLAPCRQAPDATAYCGTFFPKSCECWRRCDQYYLHNLANGEAVRDGFWERPDMGCYMREGRPADEQWSRVPEDDEPGMKYFAGWKEGAPEATKEEVLHTSGLPEHQMKVLPLSKCPDACNKRGHCAQHPSRAPECFCHRGFFGRSCEATDSQCFLDCNGKGTCHDYFCHCEPPYFSIGCSRKTAYPPNHSRPSPINFKVYMYELGTQLAYDRAHFAGWQRHDSIYTSYQYFMEEFLLSPVRTEDPSEANMFFVPMMLYSYSGNTGLGLEHVHSVLQHIKHHWPYWNRTGGRDHFYWAPADRGACYHADALALNATKIVHWGMYANHTTLGWHHPMASSEWGCYHPLRDVVTPPNDERAQQWIQNTRKLSIDELIAGKKELLFFSGGVRDNDPEYSGGTRQILKELATAWNDPEFSFHSTYVGGEYEDRLRRAKFCLAPYGHGWGMRVAQAMVTGCVPVIVQEHVFVGFDDILPYEEFSIRLSNADLPHIREILRGVSDAQYRRLLEAQARYRDAYCWQRSAGCRAFDYTIAALRRRHMNLKALFF